MTEQYRTQSQVEENVNVAVDQATKVAGSAVSLGRQVMATWLGVARTATDAAAQTLANTSKTISTIAESMGKLSNRIDDTAKKA